MFPADQVCGAYEKNALVRIKSRWPTHHQTHSAVHTRTLSCHLSTPSTSFPQYISSWWAKASLTCQASAFSCSLALTVRERFFIYFFLPFPVTDPSASIFHLLGESDCTKPLDSVSYHCYTEPALAWKVDHAVVKNGEKPLTPTAHVVYPTHPYRKRPG